MNRRFDPYSAVYGAHTPASLGQVFADAEQGGYDIEPVWIVTTMGPTRATRIHEPDGWTAEGRRWIEVAIPVPLAPDGAAAWGPADTDDYRERTRRAADAVLLERLQEALRADAPAPTWDAGPPSDAERRLMEQLRDRPPLGQHYDGLL